MKKILVLLLLIIGLPCLADNELQRKSEETIYNNYAKLSNNSILSLVSIVLVQNDYLYYTYDSNNTISIYGELLNEKNKYCSSLQADDITMCSYIKQIQKKYLEIKDFQFNKSNTSITEFATAFNKDKIKIDDKYYKKLSKSAKACLDMFCLIK